MMSVPFYKACATAFLFVALVVLTVDTARAPAEDCPDGTKFVRDDSVLEGNVLTITPVCREVLSDEVVVDPGFFVTENLYEAAWQDRKRLVQLVAKLEDKVRDVQRWRGDLSRYQDEFIELRNDAARGALSDFMGAIL